MCNRISQKKRDFNAAKILLKKGFGNTKSLLNFRLKDLYSFDQK